MIAARLTLALWVVTSGPSQPAGPTGANELHDPILETYFSELKKRGLLDNREATLEEVESSINTAQDQYIRGDFLGSAVTLFELKQNPRFITFQDLPVMSSADYHLGVALQAYGADRTAADALARVLQRGTSDSYFTPALRRHVDIALASKDYGVGLQQLDNHLRGDDGRPIELTDVDLDERTYLLARALHQGGDFERALATYAKVSSRSRFSTAALYLQGLIHAQRKQFRDAEHAFCSVVGGSNQSTAVYYVDQRYFPVRDLAQLGLGRVAHEELRHGHAFYHYFQVPQESKYVVSALFEAAWTMAEEGEHAVARSLLAELRERFPDAPQTVEARVLDALLMLYDCDFRTAERAFTDFINEVAPVADHIDEIRRDPERVRQLHNELARLRDRGVDLSGELPAHRLLLAMLDEDVTYARLAHKARVLRREATFTNAVAGQLTRLRSQLDQRDTSAASADESAALQVMADTEALTKGLAGLQRQLREVEAAGATNDSLKSERANATRLRSQVRDLKAEASQLLAPASAGKANTTDLAALMTTDLKRLWNMQAHSLRLAEAVDHQAATVASARLLTLKARINALMGEARMGRIDAVLGAKKKLEIEVRNMAAGRFPSELFGKLQIEGMVADDEEFWPYEGEYWADEYEGYR